jgi:hypothetical protein
VTSEWKLGRYDFRKLIPNSILGIKIILGKDLVSICADVLKGGAWIAQSG